ncbi:MAG: hypothetical protein Q7R76_04870 [Candidatus Woesearchaeota archaeon]|nr:hypothetical protein [Candidatus Woesearchaeota archaeon]
MADSKNLLDELLGLGAGKDAKSLPKGQTVEQAAEAFVDSVITDSARLLAAGDVKGAAKLEAEGSVVDVVAVVDRTGSMYPTIGQVEKTINDFSGELWKPGATTRFAILALTDHYGQSSFREPVLGVDIFPLNKDRAAVQQYLAGIRPAPSNFDTVENYECGWNEAAKLVSAAHVPEGKRRKVVAVTFMETAAHGQLADLKSRGVFTDVKDRYYADVFMGEDYGCPMNVNWRTSLAAFKAVSSLFYVVDCKGIQGNNPVFQIAKKSCITPGSETERYVALGELVEMIPPLIAGMIEQTRGPASYATFVADLKTRDPAAASTVAGYLGAPKITPKR